MQEYKPLKNGFRFRTNQCNTEFMIVSPKSGIYPISHPLFGQTYEHDGKMVRSDSRGDIGFVTDIDITEWMLAPKNWHNIVCVWPGKDDRALPPGQVRPFGTPMTQWEQDEAEKILLAMKKEQGLIDEAGDLVEKEEIVGYQMTPVMTTPKKKARVAV